MTYGWKRRIAGGTVDTKLYPGDKVPIPLLFLLPLSSSIKDISL